MDRCLANSHVEGTAEIAAGIQGGIKYWERQQGEYSRGLVCRTYLLQMSPATAVA